MFLQKWGGEGVLGCRYIYANKHLGTDGATECRRVWAIKEDAQRCGHKRREYIFSRKRWERGEQAGSRQRRELGYSAKGNLVRADSWHKEKSKIKHGILRVLHCKEGFHSFPGHCAVQSASPGHRNLPSLIPSLPPFPPSSLTHQVLPQPCRNSLPSLHWCKAAKKQQLVKENRF